MNSAVDDPLHQPGPPHLHWTTTNIGEAIPGVLTPLGWSLWQRTLERVAREVWHGLGVFTKSESRAPDDPDDRIFRSCYGRAALNVEMMALLGNRMPGTTGRQVVSGVFAETPETIDYTKRRDRYPHIALGLGRNLATVRRRVRKTHAATEQWWRGTIPTVAELDLRSALSLFDESTERFHHDLFIQTITLFGAVQPVYDMLDRLCRRVGTGDVVGLTSGYGPVAEAAVVSELWEVSRGRADISDVAARHGYHGPMEGELSARVWREDVAPLRRLVSEYAARDDSESPARLDRERRAERIEMERAVLAAVARRERPAVSLLLSTAARYVPLRGIAKGAFLQCLDVARAAARRIGALHAASGALAEPEDVFYLTAAELRSPATQDVAILVRDRRQRRMEYQRLRIPPHWTGTPEPITGEPDGPRPDRICGMGVSPGVVEGRVRVVLDPSTDEVGPDEVLVACTTDPSWSSIMFISAALVVDIGAALSHAAIVARDLGIPCVVNTGDGSRTLRTGDVVRVDGSTGIVEVLRPA